MRSVTSSTPTSSEVSTSRTIAWCDDDAYAQAMGTPEYSGRVRGVGKGILPTRSTSRSSARPASHDEVSVLRAQLATQAAAQQAMMDEHNAYVASQNARSAEQDRQLDRMRKLIESFMANQGVMGGQSGTFF
jgi:uncharacterized coiled-coil protein SlyX